MASQGRIHPDCSTAEGTTLTAVGRAQQLAQFQAKQEISVGSMAAPNLIVQSTLAPVPQVGKGSLQASRSGDDSQNYMIRQLQRKEQLRPAAAASAAASASASQAGGVGSANNGALKCGHCDYTCDHKDIMLGHLGAHADVLPFICSKCGLANKWHHTAWIHLQQVGGSAALTGCRPDYGSDLDIYTHLSPNV